LGCHYASPPETKASLHSAFDRYDWIDPAIRIGFNANIQKIITLTQENPDQRHNPHLESMLSKKKEWASRTGKSAGQSRNDMYDEGVIDKVDHSWADDTPRGMKSG
jgi:hypothetical protein